MMKQLLIVLALVAAMGGDALAAPAATNSVTGSRLLMIDSSSMSVGGGQVTLIIGALRRADGVYAGDYKIKVFPYFLKNEKGRLAIVVSDAALAAVNAGKVAAITGSATTSGQGGRSRPIEATATPVDLNRGQLKLWFTAGSRKMIFEPAYHFAAEATVADQAPGRSRGPTDSPPGQIAASRPEDQTAAPSHL